MDINIKLPRIGESLFDWIDDGLACRLRCQAWHCLFEHEGGGGNTGPVVSTGL